MSSSTTLLRSTFILSNSWFTVLASSWTLSLALRLCLCCSFRAVYRPWFPLHMV